MTLRNIASISTIAATVIFSGFVTTSAFAGTVVTNSTTNRNVWGNGRTDFSSLRTQNGSQDNFSQSLKMESLGERATSSVTFNGGNFYGNAWASTDNPVDPYSIGAYASQREKLNFTQQDILKGYEQFSFSGNEYSHSVSADSNN